MMAQRSWTNLTPVQALVEQACDPTLPEPNHAVNIELAELINRKKANSAREATKALLVHINSRNPNQSLLALSVLDHLVKNCGYPIHLQISTKEFLNELVRRFPERPPMVTGRVMGRILELIHEWKNTLCVHSKYKEDLVHIRDMHRLLSYKGYRFKAFDAARAMASANPNEDLKSPEELEEEDRAAKSAKLQELIRRGSPRDLAAAQELMKALAGAEPDKAVDYTAKTLSELDKVQSKAILLNDMLNNAKEGERIGLEGDVYEQVAAACRGARPKIQKWIEQDTGERADMMDRLLLCNDLINNSLERYEAVKAGDWEKAQRVVDATNPNQQAADLISFDAFADDEAPLSGQGGLSLPTDAAQASSSAGPSSQFSSAGLPLDLFSAPSPVPSPGLGGRTSSGAPKQDPMAFFRTQPPLQPQPQPAQQQFGGLGGLGGLGSFGQSSSTQQPQQPQQHQQPLGWPAASSQQTAPAGYSLSPQPAVRPIQPQQQQPQWSNGQPTQSQPQAQQSQQAQKKDAFADLVDLMG
ncbi:Golgi to vacuole transport-related protein [Papiliotrema laurentii]|uniref:Golgi to vacuole transport-related protein n=1 Tax=Papiliotrema laurentii TaxID=5418 RepID=A0AAD9FUH0_PAPLA|nr:Golgi to vacuole transport-related protein [Papiliotrema laurentii]